MAEHNLETSSLYKLTIKDRQEVVLIWVGGGSYMGSFPQPQHFFAAAQENEDFGVLWKGPSMP